MKKNKKILTAVIAFAVILTIFLAFYFLTRPKVEKGKKEISVTVVFADESQKKFDIDTDGEFLIDALCEAKITEEKKADGMYTVICGERADYSLDGRWWCVSKNGEMLSLGINDLPITDGDSFEITNTPA